MNVSARRAVTRGGRGGRSCGGRSHGEPSDPPVRTKRRCSTCVGGAACAATTPPRRTPGQRRGGLAPPTAEAGCRAAGTTAGPESGFHVAHRTRFPRTQPWQVRREQGALRRGLGARKPQATSTAAPPLTHERRMHQSQSIVRRKYTQSDQQLLRLAPDTPDRSPRGPPAQCAVEGTRLTVHVSANTPSRSTCALWSSSRRAERDSSGPASPR